MSDPRDGRPTYLGCVDSLTPVRVSSEAPDRGEGDLLRVTFSTARGTFELVLSDRTLARLAARALLAAAGDVPAPRPMRPPTGDVECPLLGQPPLPSA